MINRPKVKRYPKRENMIGTPVQKWDKEKSKQKIEKKLSEKDEPGITLEQTVLQKAQELIYGDRQKAYGSAKKNFGDIAIGWENIVGAPVSAEQVALMMIWLKVCRISAGLNRGEQPHEDSVIDIAGYAGCIEKLKTGQ